MSVWYQQFFEFWVVVKLGPAPLDNLPLVLIDRIDEDFAVKEECVLQ